MSRVKKGELTGTGICIECTRAFYYENQRTIPKFCSRRCYSHDANRRHYARVKEEQERLDNQTFLVLALLMLCVSQERELQRYRSQDMHDRADEFLATPLDVVEAEVVEAVEPPDPEPYGYNCYYCGKVFTTEVIWGNKPWCGCPI